MPKFVVRYGAMRSLGVLTTRGGDKYRRGMHVIARTNRGMETGEVLCEATDAAVDQMKEPTHGQILREMSEQDTNEWSHLQSNLPAKMKICQDHVAKLKLDMQLVELEHLFGGERLVVYYLAEQRVDFRELVRGLASEFQTRIEMRQIGVRDEAKLLADYGDCGKPVCCNTHLHAMPPVSMKMAKIQKATLDPTKISGRCGRLKCCLRYEYDTYADLHKALPPIGSEIVTREGRARVIGQEILAEQLLVVAEDNRRMLIDASEVLTILKRGAGRTKPKGRGRREAEKEPAEESGAKEQSKDKSQPTKAQQGTANKQKANKPKPNRSKPEQAKPEQAKPEQAKQRPEKPKSDKPNPNDSDPNPPKPKTE